MDQVPLSLCELIKCILYFACQFPLQGCCINLCFYIDVGINCDKMQYTLDIFATWFFIIIREAMEYAFGEPYQVYLLLHWGY
jgi:hypothetical protein